MAFKNAFKNLVAHFGIVWSLLLYFLICSAIITGLSLPFILPIARTFGDAGVFREINDAFSSLFSDGGWNGLWDGLYGACSSVVRVFKSNDRVASLIMLFLIFIVIVAFRFFFGLYEIPLATVLDGRMSCNARFGFGGKFFSALSVSIRYTLAKMPITIAFDAVTIAAVYGLCLAIGMSFILPIAVIPVVLLFWSFKSSMLACWAPCVADGEGIIKAFARSVNICFKRFGSIFSTYFVTGILILACSLFITIFTLGVGLIIALPFSTACFGYLDITEYYNKTGKRYYIDNVVFTPPTENTL